MVKKMKSLGHTSKYLQGIIQIKPTNQSAKVVSTTYNLYLL